VNSNIHLDLNPTLDSLWERFDRDYESAFACWTGSALASLIYTFLDPELWGWPDWMAAYFFDRTVFRVELPRKLRKSSSLDNVLEEILQTKGKTFGRREHSFYSEKRGMCYFWARPGSMRPLLSEQMPPCLRDLSYMI